MQIDGIRKIDNNYSSKLNTDNENVINNIEIKDEQEIDTVTIDGLTEEDGLRYSEIIQEIENLSMQLITNDSSDGNTDLNSIDSVSNKINELKNNGEIYKNQLNILNDKLSGLINDQGKLDTDYENQKAVLSDLQQEEKTEKDKLNKVIQEIKATELDIDKQNSQVRAINSTEVSNPDELFKAFKNLSVLLNTLNSLNDQKATIENRRLSIQEKIILQMNEINNTQIAISSMNKLISNTQTKRDGINENLKINDKEYNLYTNALANLKGQGAAAGNIFIQNNENKNSDMAMSIMNNNAGLENNTVFSFNENNDISPVSNKLFSSIDTDDFEKVEYDADIKFNDYNTKVNSVKDFGMPEIKIEETDSEENEDDEKDSQKLNSLLFTIDKKSTENKVESTAKPFFGKLTVNKLNK